jgi:hypothetical protein
MRVIEYTSVSTISPLYFSRVLTAWYLISSFYYRLTEEWFCGPGSFDVSQRIGFVVLEVLMFHRGVVLLSWKFDV